MADPVKLKRGGQKRNPASEQARKIARRALKLLRGKRARRRPPE